jgi:hypothetical protein
MKKKSKAKSLVDRRIGAALTFVVVLLLFTTKLGKARLAKCTGAEPMYKPSRRHTRGCQVESLNWR